MLKKEHKAITALEEAHKIAFSPFVFQATVALKKLGVFDIIFNERQRDGLTISELSNKLKISEYGLGVLLDIAESSNLISKDSKSQFTLTKTGYFLNYNETVNKNLNFTNDVCYKGLFHLMKSIETGQPEGLKEFGDYSTIYEALSSLPASVQNSWFEFDHHYSDDIFDEALVHVFQNQPKTIFDIGANTGKFAIKCLNHHPKVEVFIFDLPGQLKKARHNIQSSGFDNRVKTIEIDWLSDTQDMPKGADAIWMSQFLDCFSEDEILKILKKCVSAMTKNTHLYIIETYTDRQKFQNAKFALEATSLYFTALANGNSKMYSAVELTKLVNNAGLKIVEDKSIGDYHTLFICELEHSR